MFGLHVTDDRLVIVYRQHLSMKRPPSSKSAQEDRMFRRQPSTAQPQDRSTVCKSQSLLFCCSPHVRLPNPDRTTTQSLQSLTCSLRFRLGGSPVRDGGLWRGPTCHKAETRDSSIVPPTTSDRSSELPRVPQPTTTTELSKPRLKTPSFVVRDSSVY